MSAPTASRHHSDWLSLVEISGPFVSLPVLLRVFSQGLEPRDPTQAKALRAAYEDWQDNPAAPGQQRAWVLHVLTTVLGYPANQVVEGQALPAGLEAKMPEMGETLRPDFALTGPAGTDTSGKAQLLISSYPAEQKLDRPVIGKHWKATPATRMMELLHGAGVPLGLVTNGEQWMLVYAPRGEITGYASWFGALWLDEPITLRAFHSLLGVRRFFGVADDSTLLALLKESANDQQEVTDQLGFQVREAVEVLVQSFDALDKDSNRILLEGVSPTAQYEAALTIMMRLVFLFSAEERGLLHLGKPLYDNNYAVSTLQEQLQEVADLYGEEVLERRTDAWARLLSSFRAVHGGVKHQDLLMQAYGGSLFDPDRYPFLEGRAAGSLWRKTTAEPLGVNNRVVLHLLNSLQRLRIKSSGGGAAETRRISFRALGVEQIGHVYEGLLDHTGVLAIEPVLGIKGPRNREVEIPLSKLESLLAQGQDKLIEFLKETSSRSSSAIRKSLGDGSLLDEHKLLVACGYDRALLTRLSPFARLIREDSFERPLVVLTGSVYVTAGTDRRSSGTHYTPPTLTEPIVQNTLEPLVYQGPPDGWPRAQWKLKSPQEILDLKVCDMAMGSGAFLVQVCRYLAERLVEAWENEEKLHPGQVLITPDGKFSDGSPSERLVPAEAAERIAIARRVVADRCLYGVDINPMAVEMAKLSMWLITVDANRPFTFLDHAFKCGDSLLGVTSLEQLERFSLRPDGGKQHAFATLNLKSNIDQAMEKRRALESMPSDTPEQIEHKLALFFEAEQAVAKLSAAADILLAVELRGSSDKIYEAERESAAENTLVHWSAGAENLRKFAASEVKNRHPMHWAISLPEIVARGGFDAIIGNPPYLGGKRISFRLGEQLFQFLKGSVGHAIATTDLCVFFLLRSASLLRSKGCLGLVVSDIVRQGDSRVTGLEKLLSDQFSVFRAVSSTDWPGSAGVKVSHVHLFKAKWGGKNILDNQEVKAISSYLRLESEVKGTPFPLLFNSAICFTGHYLMGQGFVLSNEDAEKLIASNSRNSEVIFDYIRGDDTNNCPTLLTGEKVINFGIRTLEECQRDYPECLDRIERLVKPERALIKPRNEREHWWRYARARPTLEKAISALDTVLVQPFTAKFVIPTFVPARSVFAHPLVVIADDSPARFAVLQSTIHLLWVWEYCSTSLNLLRYTASDVLETFPFPSPLESNILNSVGHRYISHRDSIRKARNISSNEIYNEFHDSKKMGSDIKELRALHVEMDCAIAAAYGWNDFDLDHAFIESKQGVRFTLADTARRQVLDRLLTLNHERHVEEEAEAKANATLASAKRGREKSVLHNPTLGLFE